MKTSTLAVLLVLTSPACIVEPPVPCDDLGPRDQARFEDVRSLFQRSCAGCHNADNPIHAYDFDHSATIYDALATKIEVIYPIIESGQMPKNAPRWTASELRVLRSWYCYGGLHEP